MSRTFLVYAVTVAAATAHAETERAALIAIDLGPAVPPYVRTTVTQQTEAGLAAAGFQVTPARDSAKVLSGELVTCRQGPCTQTIGERLGVGALVFATISANGENLVVGMRLVDATTGALQAEVADICDLCGEAELGERIAVIASSLRARAVEARRRRSITTLGHVPLPAAAADVGHERGSLAPGIAIGIGGALAIGTGLYLLSIDGDGTCSPGDQPVYPAPDAVIRYPDPANREVFVCRDVYNTSVVGVTAMGIGAAAVIGGTMLVLRARRGRMVEVRPEAGGASVKVTMPW